MRVMISFRRNLYNTTVIEPIRQLIQRRKVVEIQRITKSFVIWGARYRKATCRELGTCLPIKADKIL